MVNSDFNFEFPTIWARSSKGDFLSSATKHGAEASFLGCGALPAGRELVHPMSVSPGQFRGCWNFPTCLEHSVFRLGFSKAWVLKQEMSTFSRNLAPHWFSNFHGATKGCFPTRLWGGRGQGKGGWKHWMMGTPEFAPPAWPLWLLPFLSLNDIDYLIRNLKQVKEVYGLNFKVRKKRNWHFAYGGRSHPTSFVDTIQYYTKLFQKMHLTPIALRNTGKGSKDHNLTHVKKTKKQKNFCKKKYYFYLFW